MSSGWDEALKLSDEVKSSNSKFLSLGKKDTPDKEFTIGVLGSGPRSKVDGSIEPTRKWWDADKKKMHDDAPGMDKKGFSLLAEFKMNWLELASGNGEAKTFIVYPEPRRRIITFPHDAFVRVCEATEETDSDDGIWMHKFEKAGNKKTFPFKRYEGKKLDEILTDELKAEIAKFHLNKSERFPWYNLSAGSHADDDEAEVDDKPPVLESSQYETLVSVMKQNGGEEVVAALKKEFGVEKLKLLPKTKFDASIEFVKSFSKKKNGAASNDEFAQEPAFD